MQVGNRLASVGLLIGIKLWCRPILQVIRWQAGKRIKIQPLPRAIRSCKIKGET